MPIVQVMEDFSVWPQVFRPAPMPVAEDSSSAMKRMSITFTDSPGSVNPEIPYGHISPVKPRRSKVSFSLRQ